MNKEINNYSITILHNIKNGCGAFRQVAFRHFLKACGVLKNVAFRQIENY